MQFGSNCWNRTVSLYLLIISLRKINTRNFFFRKKDFFDALNLVSLVICFCRNCTISNQIYCINNNSKKYIKYMRFNCNCNLIIFSTLIKQIYKEQIQLKKEVRNTYTKLSRLKKQLDFLKNKKKK